MRCEDATARADEDDEDETERELASYAGGVRLNMEERARISRKRADELLMEAVG